MTAEPGPIPEGKMPEHRVQIAMPEARVAGSYADLVSVWHTPDSFVLDFSAFSGPPQLLRDDDREVVVQNAEVVSRVRIPPSQVFEIMKALEQQLTAWERQTGRSSSSAG
jgi:hypothetical protein